MIRALNGWTEPTLAERLDWRYLAGIIDGEGSCRHQGSITIHQSKEKNPSVYAEIKSVLGRLAIPYREYLYKYKACSSFHLEGGRSMKAKLLKYGTPAKKDQILAGLLTHTSRVGLSRDKVIRIEGDSVETVYALTTGTGNYISQGYASKNCQYQNSPVSAVDATFRPEWFKYYIDDDLKNIELNYFLTLDPAISLEKSADFTVFMICALDTVNNLYIIKIDRGKYLPDEIIKRLFEYNKRYRLCTNGIEVVAFQKTLRYQINDEMRKRNHFISVTELKHNSTVSKENRIIALQPRYEQGAIFHRQGDDMTTELESELIHFPRSKHDDISDTLASQLEIAFQPIQRKEKEKKKNKKKNKYASW
jgi:predicted phage terminase large subunit-like protein